MKKIWNWFGLYTTEDVVSLFSEYQYDVAQAILQNEDKPLPHIWILKKLYLL